jgi:hypothetical protein
MSHRKSLAKSSAATGVFVFIDRYRAWLFPAALTVLLLAFTAASISGSSLGVYDALLGQTNHNLIAGTPQSDRSDEWLVNTPLVLSQRANHYRAVNPSVGKGDNATVVIDVPYKQWSIIFRPQNLAFFILPFTNAFAFKWWFLLYVLLLSVYLFVLTLFPRRYLLASLLALFSGFSPYIQWWYQSITILSVAYTLLLVSLSLRLVEAQNRRLKVLLAILIGYTATAFALLLYPPFQIPCAFVGLAIFICAYLSRAANPRALFKNKLWLWFVVPLVCTGLILGGFILSNQHAISLEAHTIYPGKRVVPAGGASLMPLLNWPLSYLLLRHDAMTIYGNNPSESSNSLLFGICLVPYLVYALFIRKERPAADNGRLFKLCQYLFIGIGVVLALLLARLFIPFGDPVYKALGLSAIPHTRLFLAMGIINVCLLAIAVNLPVRAYKNIKSLLDWPSVFVGVGTLAVLLIALRAFKHAYPLPVDTGKFEIAAAALVCALLAALLCHRLRALRYAGLAGMVLYALWVALPVNPLYHGLGSLENSKLSDAIVKVHSRDPDSAWIVVNKVPLESLPTALGAQNYSGLYPYPQPDIWSKYFPQSAPIYNRFAHVTFNVDDSLPHRSMRLVQNDTFAVNVTSCDPMLRNLNVNYLLVVSRQQYTCFKPLISVPAPGTEILVYKRI